MQWEPSWTEAKKMKDINLNHLRPLQPALAKESTGEKMTTRPPGVHCGASAPGGLLPGASAQYRPFIFIQILNTCAIVLHRVAILRAHWLVFPKWLNKCFLEQSAPVALVRRSKQIIVHVHDSQKLPSTSRLIGMAWTRIVKAAF